ncbi:NAD(P)H-dependent oxidoreductase [Pseudoclavibacter sp. VKM Ac-2867]|uniref:NAD(P)H-dependent oxidoreductase n=1 Tax=Pseudoclavibacter sp. VKM Ac-2867 TaxID=2783829 RepID=UPI00188B550D|nr:NAD(P)H-dependent oxidoreductase [Pseudoclavibacter sp. VKM Ac-2867]MBF4460450.1 NAD(P)H-dependent oxidoreductase [Pseudoclavibacter sp. VKM Ac-2867]
MPTLIVTAHPDEDSLTHAAALQLRERLEAAGVEVELAHLSQEGFDPRFTARDRADYKGGTITGPDVLAEQARLGRASDVVLVFPVFWWSMPALLKGWIDRVFITGWAFELGDDGRVLGKLGHLTAHLLPVSGFSEASFARHGYEESFSTQIEHGVFDYCGMPRGAKAFIRESEDAASVKLGLEAAVAKVAAAVGAPSKA